MTTSEPQRFQRLPLIGAGADLRTDIEAWLASEPLAALLRQFDGEPARYAAHPASPPAQRLAALDAFTERWDTRQGRERNLAEELDLRPGQQELIIDAANALGLRGDPPKHDRYDHMLMLGGLVRACVARPSYAAHLIREGEITAGEVTTLGAHRPFVGNEFEQAEQLGWAASPRSTRPSTRAPAAPSIWASPSSRRASGPRTSAAPGA